MINVHMRQLIITIFTQFFQTAPPTPCKQNYYLIQKRLKHAGFQAFFLSSCKFLFSILAGLQTLCCTSHTMSWGFLFAVLSQISRNKYRNIAFCILKVYDSVEFLILCALNSFIRFHYQFFLSN